MGGQQGPIARHSQSHNISSGFISHLLLSVRRQRDDERSESPAVPERHP
ncbi:hypothetical protein RHOER0001_5700 [Rhodococcus erythropolis SK121]|nr:hypothetical protein RHOER0001_5700 [Rhodococcus erythropolis SK121]